MLLLVTAMAASAQKPDGENFSKRLFEARLAEICLRLNLSDEQKNKFAPLYEQYCNEMRELRGKPHDGRQPMRPGMRPGPGRPGMHPEGRGMHERPNKAEKPNKPERGDNAERKDNADKKDNAPKADRQKKENKEPVSDADKVKRMKERMEKQKKAQEIRLAYADKFAAVLSDKQLVEFFEVENKIQEKLQNRAFKARPEKK